LTLDQAVLNTNYLVERIPEEDEQLLRFLDDARITPGYRLTVLDAAAYLGVLTVATETATVPIGYSVAHQIMVLPPQPDPDN
jgi:hypothetical protein